MNEGAIRQIDAFATPGRVLKEAREAQGMNEREAADRLNLMPDYVGILERDDYQSLRSPAFAKGYIRAYGRLLGVDEQRLLQLFDDLPLRANEAPSRRIETRPMQLQRTGVGVVVGLAVLVVFVALLWWRGTPEETRAPGEAVQQGAGQREAEIGNTQLLALEQKQQEFQEQQLQENLSQAEAGDR